MVAGPARIGKMLHNGEMAAMVQQAVEHIGRFMGSSRDDLDVVRAVLVGDMGVKAEAGINAITGVDVAPRCRALAASEKLPV